MHGLEGFRDLRITARDKFGDSEDEMDKGVIKKGWKKGLEETYSVY